MDPRGAPSPHGKDQRRLLPQPPDAAGPEPARFWQLPPCRERELARTRDPRGPGTSPARPPTGVFGTRALDKQGSPGSATPRGVRPPQRKVKPRGTARPQLINAAASINEGARWRQSPPRGPAPPGPVGCPEPFHVSASNYRPVLIKVRAQPFHQPRVAGRNSSALAPGAGQGDGGSAPAPRCR